jgi:aspartate dehydrogenase
VPNPTTNPTTSRTKAGGPIKIGIAGLGTIGTTIAETLLTGLPGYQLSAVAVRNPNHPTHKVRNLLEADPQIAVVGLEDLAATCDTLIEAIPAHAYDQLLRPAVLTGKTIITLSCGALLTHWDLVDLAHQHGATIIVPSGAIPGLDALQAAAQGTITTVHLTTHNINLDTLTQPTRIFTGTARQAATAFPANLNVATTLALAGIGPDRTTVEIWADPHAKTNTHTITIHADTAQLDLTIHNTPTPNPKTGKLTALSVIAHLKKQAATLRIGT